jgi:2-(3-amino-3-carboxypropyl)histidine synthase
MQYDFEIERLKKEIRKRKAKCVLIQLPEGLKAKAREIAEQLPCEVVISADPCYGACDIRKIPECDLTIHFGHSKLTNVPGVIYVECYHASDCVHAAKNAVHLLKEKKIGLVTTAQHVHELEKVAKALEAAHKLTFIGESKRAPHPGQILGCDLSAAESIADRVDAFLYIGSGRFHPLGVAYATNKRVVAADPYSGHVQEVSAEQWEKERHIRGSKAHGAVNFGVVVGTKPGQRDFALARKVKQALEKKGKKAFIIVMEEIEPDRIDYLPFDAFVITACPRIVLDDWKNYRKPLLLPGEI